MGLARSYSWRDFSRAANLFFCRQESVPCLGDTLAPPAGRTNVEVLPLLRVEGWRPRLPHGTPCKGDPFHLFVRRDTPGTVWLGVHET